MWPNTVVKDQSASSDKLLIGTVQHELCSWFNTQGVSPMAAAEEVSVDITSISNISVETSSSLKEDHRKMLKAFLSRKDVFTVFITGFVESLNGLLI